MALVSYGTFFALDFFMEDTDLMQLLIKQNFGIAVIHMSKGIKRDGLPRITGYVENVIPRFISEDYRTHFRVSEDIFQTLLDKIVDKLTFLHAGGHDQVPPEKQLLVFLCYMANQETMREIGQYFGLGTSTVHRTLARVTEAVNSSFINLLKWPSFEEQGTISRENQLVHGLPDSIAALDGTHIRLSHCLNEDQDYMNRKQFPSMQLQIVVDNKMLITHAYTGWPGCTHDARVLRNSSLHAMAEDGNLVAPNLVIIADSAYTLRQWLVTPFRDNGHLNAQQRRFNKVISSCRQIVERTIGHLKGRFRRLREITVRDPVVVASIIISGCILHNFCVINHEDIENFIDPDIDVNVHPNQYQNIFVNAMSGVARREQMMNQLP